MRVNEAGLKLIMEFEGCSLEAYPDPATGASPWTIGFGHTGPEVKKGQIITLELAQAYLQQDIKKFEDGILKVLKTPVSDNQLSAMVALAFNIGLNNFKKSTLLMRVNQRDFRAAADQFDVWCRAAGKIMKGLQRRRAAEKDLFLSAMHS